MAKFGSEYFENNPAKKVENMEQIVAPVPQNINNKLDENLSHASKSALIKKVFENKAITQVERQKMRMFDEGDEVESSIYTPYEFLHELLPKVYLQANGLERYIVDDGVGQELNRELAEEKLALDEETQAILEENGADSIYELPEEIVKELSTKRKNLEAKSIFITESELQAYVITNLHLNSEHYVKEVTMTLQQGVDMGLICYDYNYGNPKYVYKYQYITGNLYKKKTDLVIRREEVLQAITEEQYQYQKQLLEEHIPVRSRITVAKTFAIYLNAHSHFCNDEAIININNDDFDDWDGLDYTMSLAEAFVEWLPFAFDEGIILEKELQGQSKQEIIDVYVKNKKPDVPRTKTDKRTGEELQLTTEELRKSIANAREKAQKVGQPMFDTFLQRGINDRARRRVEIEWNSRFNAYVLPIFHKTPVALTLARYFKKDIPFIPNPTQVQAVQFMINCKSGLLAYGVGVGKTASSILNISYALDNNLCDRPLFVVPLPTYEKWKLEMEGGRVEKFIVRYTENGEQLEDVFETQRKANGFVRRNGGTVQRVTYFSKGLLPHLPNIVDLGNLNWEKFIKNNIKEYSDEELEEIDGMKEAIDFVKGLKNNYTRFEKRFIKDPDTERIILQSFDGFNEEAEITRLFPTFNAQEFNRDYNTYQATFIPQDNGRVEAGKSKKKDPITFLLKGFHQKGQTDALTGLTRKTEFSVFGLEDLYKQRRLELGTYKDFPPKTMFIMTYQGLEYLGSEKRTVENAGLLQTDNSLFGEIFYDISQGESLEANIGDGGSTSISEMIENELFGSPTKAKIFLNDLGIDYLTVDESHFFKKTFTTAKGRPYGDYNPESGRIYRGQKKYGAIGSPNNTPSARSLRMYMVTRYVQHKSRLRFPNAENIGGNVCHLTATPFTNSPIEVYSMMALVNIDFLKHTNMFFVEDFFDAFMKVEFALRFRASKIVKEQVLLGYNNAPQMRRFIYYLMDYKSGNDANIKRPEKVILPDAGLGVNTIMSPTLEQERLIRDIKSYIRGRLTLAEVCGDVTEEVNPDDLSNQELMDYLLEGGTDSQVADFVDKEELSESDRIRLIEIVRGLIEKADEVQEEDLDKREQAVYRFYKGMTYIRQVTLSPYLLQCRKAQGTEPTFREYIESSPKLLYTINCIKSTHDYEDANEIKRTGIVIYMNIGIDPSAKVPIGEPEAFVDGQPIYTQFETRKWNSGGFDKIKQYMVNVLGYSESEIVIVKGGMSNANKESAKNKFLSGVATVLIGSSTISTGVDLQNNASSLFLCSFDFNPTDNEQISGRIHRQGNCRDKVRIVYPMISDSIDPIIFQLLQEKTARINEVWDKEGSKSALSLEDFNPAELQEQLIKDPEDRVEMWYERTVDRINDDISETEQKQIILRRAFETYSDYTNYMPFTRNVLTVIDAYRKYQTQQEGIETTKERIAEIMEEEFEDKIKETKNKKGEVTKTEVIETAEEQQVKAINKLKKERYDYASDPDGRFVPTDYSEMTPDELAKKVVYLITKANSWWSEQNYYDYNAMNEFTAERYNNWFYGNYITEEKQNELIALKDTLEQEQIQASNSIDVARQEKDAIRQRYDNEVEVERKIEIKDELINKDIDIKSLEEVYTSKRDAVMQIESQLENYVDGIPLRFNSDWSGMVNKYVSREWLSAWRDMRQKRKVLSSWGVNPEDITEARSQIALELNGYYLEKENLEREKITKLEQFKVEYEEMREVAPSMEEMVESFASVNELFVGKDARLECFEIDKTPTTEEIPEAEEVEEVEEFEEVEDADIEEMKDKFWFKVLDYHEENNIEEDEDLIVEFIDEEWSEKLSDAKNIKAYLKYADIEIETPATEPEAEEPEAEEPEADNKIDEYLDDIEGYEILLELADEDDTEEIENIVSAIEGYAILIDLEGGDTTELVKKYKLDI